MKLAGSLKAVFAHAAVARSSEEGRLLTLLHPSRGLVPFGLVVDWDEARLSINDTVVLAERALRLGEDCLVELEGEGVDLTVRPSPFSWAALRAQLGSLRLRPRTRELLGAESDDLIVRAAAKRLEALLAALIQGAGARASAESAAGDDPTRALDSEAPAGRLYARADRGEAGGEVREPGCARNAAGNEPTRALDSEAPAGRLYARADRGEVGGEVGEPGCARNPAGRPLDSEA
ncbi:MAG: hypothetical protein ACOX6T_06695, partial [Myxococcales bacterium]